MPISEAALSDAKNSFLAVSGNASVGQAVGALQNQDGQPWWHLVVKMDDGSWGVIRFSDLYPVLKDKPDAADIRLGSSDVLLNASTVEKNDVETSAAETLAKKSESQVLVVTDGGLPVGLIIADVRRGASVPASKLADLGGKYVNLRDYGSILLSSSKK